MGDVTRVLAGLDEFEVTGAVEVAGGLEVSVRVACPAAACPACGTFSSRVKEYRTQRVRDGLSFDRLTVLVWTKRRHRLRHTGLCWHVHRVRRLGVHAGDVVPEG